MAEIIKFKKNEKLAILKIMIDINNHYSSLLSPKAFKVIQDTANIFFSMPNGIAEAYDMTISDAKKILGKAIGDKHEKRNIFDQLLGYMIMKSDYGTCKKAKELNDEYIKKSSVSDDTYDDDFDFDDDDDDFDDEFIAECLKEDEKRLEEYNKNISLLTEKFIKEWSYVFRSLEKEIIPPHLKECTASLLLICTNCPFDNWVIIDENEEKKVINTKTTKPVVEKAKISKKVSEKTKSNALSNKHSSVKRQEVSSVKETSFSDIIGEILYKDL